MIPGDEEPDYSNLRLGCIIPEQSAIKLKFSSYIDYSHLPQIPKDGFGHEMHDPPIPWGMLGNNQYGDCVVAGGCHESQIFSYMGGKPLTFTTKDCLADFQKITGLPLNPFVGADMQKAAQYRQNTGLLGADGNRHRIAAYVLLPPGDLRALYAAIYLFGAAGMAFRFPAQAMEQFTRHEAWHIVSGMSFNGEGHYVPAVAVRSNIVGVTWGRFQAIRPSFYSSLCEMALAYVSPEALINRKSPEGFDYDSLVKDLKYLGGLPG